MMLRWCLALVLLSAVCLSLRIPTFPNTDLIIGGEEPATLPDFLKAEDREKYVRDNIPETRNQSTEDTDDTKVAQKLVCGAGLLMVQYGLKEYYNQYNWNSNAQKCDWTWFGTSKCDPVFHNTYTWVENGNTRYHSTRSRVYKQTTQIIFHPTKDRHFVCVRPGTLVTISTTAYDDDVTTATELIGTWSFQHYAYQTTYDSTETKTSYHSRADVTAIFHQEWSCASLNGLC